MGNYDYTEQRICKVEIIPQREKMGNYDCLTATAWSISIIPQREKMGNYDEVEQHKL